MAHGTNERDDLRLINFGEVLKLTEQTHPSSRMWFLHAFDPSTTLRAGRLRGAGSMVLTDSLFSVLRSASAKIENKMIIKYRGS